MTGSTIERLATLCVADVMTQVVVQVNAHQSMDEAAGVLRKHHLTWAPVVDEQGRCVGVLSATDFLRKHGCDAFGRPLPGCECDWARDDQDADAAQRLEPMPDDRVTQYMSSGVQTVAAESKLLVAAQMMFAEHLHRLPVVDVQGRPRGVISTMDVIAALIQSIDEEQLPHPRT